MKYLDTLYNLQLNSFRIFIFLTYFVLLLSMIGISTFAPEYLKTIDNYVRIYICLFLLFRFHPYQKVKQFTELDRMIVFSSGIFILTTTAIYNNLLRFETNFTNSLIRKNTTKEVSKKVF